jgi:hypothetical protein
VTRRCIQIENGSGMTCRISLGKSMNKARKDAWVEKVGKPLAAKAVSMINDYVEVIFVNRLNKSGMTY